MNFITGGPRYHRHVQLRLFPAEGRSGRVASKAEGGQEQGLVRHRLRGRARGFGGGNYHPAGLVPVAHDRRPRRQETSHAERGAARRQALQETPQESLFFDNFHNFFEY